MYVLCVVCVCVDKNLDKLHLSINTYQDKMYNYVQTKYQHLRLIYLKALPAELRLTN